MAAAIIAYIVEDF